MDEALCLPNKQGWVDRKDRHPVNKPMGLRLENIRSANQQEDDLLTTLG